MPIFLLKVLIGWLAVIGIAILVVNVVRKFIQWNLSTWIGSTEFTWDASTKQLISYVSKLTLKEQLIYAPHMLEILFLAHYMKPDEEPSDDDLKQLAATDRPSQHDLQERAKASWRDYLLAARKVNFFVRFPSLIFLTVFTLLDLLSNKVLKSDSFWAQWSFYRNKIAGDFGDPRWIRDFGLDLRPMFLTWFCLVPPIALVLMISNFLRALFEPVISKFRKGKENSVMGMNCLRLNQQIDRSNVQNAVSFYNSYAFNIGVALPFILGIPAAIAYWFYLGVDPLLGHPSANPQFSTVFVKIDLYMYSLGACLSALFFRSYFTFAWNFTSAEYDIEVYEDEISVLPVKGWFLDFLTLRSWHMPMKLKWSDVVGIRFYDGNLDQSKLKPSPLVEALGKITAVYDSMARKMNIHTEFLEIKTAKRTMSIRLWELSALQKVELFNCIRKYAPSIYLDDKVQKALVGSNVLKEPKYTEIWFSILTSKDSGQKGDLEAGHLLRAGMYKVNSTIASGGQAVVYRAENESGNEVVLKEFQLTEGESMDAKIESARPFENESAMLSRLKHPAIVNLLDIFYENGRVYLALEHVPGITLREYVSKSGRLSPAETIRLAEQMCEILAYLHSQSPPVVHRDFTPENLIVQPDGKIKLIDFSIAESKNKRQEGECAGKHSYTPPEQFRGDACPASDIYALGATMHFMITGEDPIPITTSELPVEQCPETLAKIIRTSTALDLEHRYESIDWMAAELREVATNSTDSELSTKTTDSVNGAEGAVSIKLDASTPEPIIACNKDKSRSEAE